MIKNPSETLSQDDSIALMQQQLETLGFVIEEVNWFNPVPHVWSVELRDRDCSLLTSLGKGITPEAAKASALGGFIERLATNHYFANYYLGAEIAQADFVHHPDECWFKATSQGLPPGLLDSHCRDHFDPHEQLCGDQLIDLNSSNEVRGVCALPFTRQSDGEKVWFPVNLINNLYDSNGMAAGDSRWEARVQALSEVYERHIKSTIIANGIALPRIPPRTVAQHPRVEAAIKALRVKGFVVDVRDASLGGKYPLVSITLFDRESRGAIAAFGAHPKFRVAMERALTALLQGRSIDDLHTLPELTFDLGRAAKAPNLTQHILTSDGVLPWDMYSDQPAYPFCEWNIEGDVEAEFKELASRIHTVDVEIYLAEYDHLGVPVCRILVPGMSEIRPVEGLVWNNNNAVIPIRPLILAAAQLEQDELLDLLDEMDQRVFSDEKRLSSLMGLVSDSDAANGYFIAEFKLALALATKERELLPTLIQAVLELSELGETKRKDYELLSHLINIDLDKNRKQSGFERMLISLYGEDAYQQAKARLKGEGVFNAMLDKLDGLNRSQQYASLLSIYHRLKVRVANVTNDAKAN